MPAWNSKPESNLDRALRIHSEAVREDRTQQANDARRTQGLEPMHCGIVTSRNSAGDSQCGSCGDVF
ncbi:hypothetical protein ABT090_20960 [Streptomyces asoensis]|uniref:hypothetical protein n=1 Tax=Streptomyces asoensis TaxID=249586 RepID=UPI003317F466